MSAPSGVSTANGSARTGRRLPTTVSGTTVSSYVPPSSAGRYAVESVTTATGMRAR